MIKWFSSQWSGSPANDGTTGSLKTVLKACLIDGFGVKTPSAVVITSGVAVFTVTAPHTFNAKAVARIAGTTTTGGVLNGDRRVISQTSTSISVDATGISDQTASLSTPTIKIAPLDWTELFAGAANKFAARSAQMDSTKMCLRVDDNAGVSPQIANVVAYENMSDIDTGVGLFPNTTQEPDGLWWVKSNAASSAARDWWLVGDEYGFYFCGNETTANGHDHWVFYFGDIKPYRAGDPYAAFISGHRDSGAYSSSNEAAGNLAYSNASYPSGRYIARQYSGIGGPSDVTTVCAGALASDGMYSGGNGYLTPYPANPGNLLLTAEVLVKESANFNNYRGQLPGFHHITQNMHTPVSYFASGTILPGAGAYAGREFLAVGSGNVRNNNVHGNVLFDLTGPWR